MRKEISVRLALDSKSKQELKPLKITVTYNRRPQQYSIGDNILLTKEEFANSKLKKHKEAMEKATPALLIAKRIASEMQQEFEDNASCLTLVFAKFKQRFRDEYFGKRNRDTTLFSVVAEEYIDKLTAIKTQSSYKTSVNWVLQFRQNLLINSLNEEIVEEFKTYMKEAHRMRRGKNMAENSVRIHLRQLKAIYNYAIEKGYAQGANPFRTTPKQPQTSIRRDNVALSDDVFNAIFQYTPQNDLQRLALDFFVLLFHMAGCNLGDVLLLKNANIKDGIVSFQRAKTKKSGTIITFQLTTVARAILTKYGTINPANPTDFILPYMSGNSGAKNMQYRKDSFRDKINRGLAEICAALDIPKVTAGMMRHTYATFAMNHGLSTEEIQRLLGHADVKTTQIYLDRLSNARLDRNRQLLEQFGSYEVKKNMYSEKSNN